MLAIALENVATVLLVEPLLPQSCNSEGVAVGLSLGYQERHSAWNPATLLPADESLL